MGEEILKLYKNKVKKEYKIAFFITFILAILIHAYKFFNYIPNGDSIYNYYYHQDVTESGRWILGLVCSISSYFDLPWVIGLLSSIYMGLTVVTLTALFKVKNPIVIGIIAGLLVSSPCTIDTFHYLYTADGYLLGMFLAALAVYLSRIEEKRFIYKIISIILLCFSCAIYQTNIAFALMLSLCSLLQVLIENKYKKNNTLKWIIQEIFIYVISLTLYYIIWKIILKMRNILPYDYLGISTVGRFGIDYIKHGFVNSFKTFFEFFFLWDIKEYGLVQYNVYSILFLLFLVFILIFVVIKQKIYKRIWAFVTFIIVILLIIPTSSFWYFTSLELSTISYMPKMLYSLSLLYIFAVVLYEKYANKRFKNLLAMLMCLIIFYNFIMANITYFYMEIVSERTHADASEMVNRINELTTENSRQITELVIVGDRTSESNYNYKDEKNQLNELSKYKIVFPCSFKNLIMDAKHTYLYLKANFEIPYTMRWDSNYLASYLEKEEIDNMPVWPHKDSIMVFENKLIIKLSK